MLAELLVIGYAPVMQMQWEILSPGLEKMQAIQRQLNCHPVTAAVLANRHIATPDQIAGFLNPTLDKLPAPSALLGLTSAVDRILNAIFNNEKILIFGDYDADGVTATAVLYNFLKSAGAFVVTHLPHRIKEGYGLSPMHITQLAVPGRIGLIITVDNGSSSIDAIAAAKRFGIDVIVTDHHNLDAKLPQAHTLINPKMDGHPDEMGELAGVGVAFYLVIALRAALREKGWWQKLPEPNLKTYCDLVAIGTMADMVSLKNVNRVLVRAGLDQINNGTRPGILALLEATGVKARSVTAEDIAFRLGPRINAAGRMAHAGIALDMLCASNIAAAAPLAESLNILNQRRQQMENDIYNQIVRNLESRSSTLDRPALILAGPNWHEGVLGIVATKLVGRYHRPVIVLSADSQTAKGSGRSVAHIDLYAALKRCDHLLEKFGGHPLAAGLTVQTQNIGKLREAFETVVAQMAQTAEPAPQLEIDCEIELEQINAQLVDELERLAPFGTDNPAPMFMARDVRVTSAAVVGRRHRKMSLCQPSQSTPPLSAMLFNIAPDDPRPEAFDRIAFKLQWNRYRGNKEIQMVLEAF